MRVKLNLDNKLTVVEVMAATQYHTSTTYNIHLRTMNGMQNIVVENYSLSRLERKMEELLRQEYCDLSMLNSRFVDF